MIASEGSQSLPSRAPPLGAARVCRYAVLSAQVCVSTLVPARVNKVMTQLKLDADEDEPDQTVIGKVLGRAEEVAADTISDALKTALKRLLRLRMGGTPAGWNQVGPARGDYPIR